MSMIGEPHLERLCNDLYRSKFMSASELYRSIARTRDHVEKRHLPLVRSDRQQKLQYYMTAYCFGLIGLSLK